MSDPIKAIPEPKATELIDEIMDSFEFGKVATMMEAVRWCWGSSRVSPDESELRSCARKLLKQVAASPKDDYTSTGGFTVRKYGDDRLELAWGVDWMAGGD